MTNKRPARPYTTTTGTTQYRTRQVEREWERTEYMLTTTIAKQWCMVHSVIIIVRPTNYMRSTRIMWSSDNGNQPIVGMLHKQCALSNHLQRKQFVFVLTNANATKLFPFSRNDESQREHTHRYACAIIPRSDQQDVRTWTCTLIRIGRSERSLLRLVWTNNNNDAMRCACLVHRPTSETNSIYY